MNRKKINKGLVGVAGEYYVAAELSKRGYLASITLRNSESIDILCSNQEGTKAVSIQVKTSNSSNPQWILTGKAEKKFTHNLFYVFVLLQDLDSKPDFYIVPSKDVADYVRTSHAQWLQEPKKNEEKHKDNDIRNFRDVDGNYKDRWDLLGLDSEEQEERE